MRLVALPSRNKLYAIGGFTTSDIHDTVQEYDPNANIWITQTSVPIPRHSTATTEVGGKVYTFGGSLFPHFFTFLSPLPLTDVEEGQ
jgi:hypothetical protein